MTVLMRDVKGELIAAHGKSCDGKCFMMECGGRGLTVEGNVIRLGEQFEGMKYLRPAKPESK